MGRLRTTVGKSLVLATLIAGTFHRGWSQSQRLEADRITGGALGRVAREYNEEGEAVDSLRRSLAHNAGVSVWVENLDFAVEKYSDGGEGSRDRRLSKAGTEDDAHLRGHERRDEGLHEDARLVVTTARELVDLDVEQEIDWKEVAKQRDYLNDLVDQSIARTKEQVCNVAFAKTHKTASTTLAMILVRYAKRHDKKLASFGGHHVSAIPLPEAVQQVKESGERVDVMHYHYTDAGSYKDSWEHAKEEYAEIMREGERINFITVMRDHRSHFLSYYYYYIQPEVHLSVEHFYRFGGKRKDVVEHRPRLNNPMCFEFGIRSEEDLENFIANELEDFRLIMLTEDFDQGLLVLRRMFGWDMIDITYERMMETKNGVRRWDGKELKNVPHFEDLSEKTREIIDNNTALDKRLYEAAESLYHMRLAAIAHELEVERREFQELQDVLTEYLEHNASSLAQKWYGSRVQPYLGGPPFYAF